MHKGIAVAVLSVHTFQTGYNMQNITNTVNSQIEATRSSSSQDGGDRDGKSEDIAILSKWVKKTLFISVQFVFEHDQISGFYKVNGDIYNMFLRDCRFQLVGLKLKDNATQVEKRDYVDKLWTGATAKKVNVISEGLNQRRCSIYSTMQNRFIELCNLAIAENAIFPSLEALEKGIQIPTVYMIFYEYFFKASVGDIPWKAVCYEGIEEGSTGDPTKPLAPIQLEAFTFIMLRNNYFAWLWEAKKRARERLVTDYDNESLREGKDDLHDLILKGLEVSLKTTFPAGMEFVPNENQKQNLLVTNETDPVLYELLRRTTESSLQNVREEVKDSPQYQEILRLIAKMDDENVRNHQEQVGNTIDDDDDNSDSGSPSKEDDDALKERRRILRAFRVYTSPKDAKGDKTGKGWSVKAHEDHSLFTTRLRNEEPMARQFRTAYRMSYYKKTHRNKKRKSIEDPINPDWIQNTRDFQGVEEIVFL